TFSGLLLWLILLLDTSILTNQEAVLRGLNTIFYEKFMQLESLPCFSVESIDRNAKAIHRSKILIRQRSSAVLYREKISLTDRTMSDKM
ncbi:MAG: hypothetical protein M0Z67_13925, partial [Nitrospiraceae bacterium]|nr:hypothetical protein [Nitrospiraceae bacterium]